MNGLIKKTFFKYTSIVLVFAFPSVTFAASFDCSKASSSTEKLICSDANVSKLDEKLAISYKQALSVSVDKDVIKKQQREWLKKQHACKNTSCLSQSYRARIDDLNSSAAREITSSVTTASSATSKQSDPFRRPLMFKLVFGDSYPICQPFVDMLNEAKYQNNPVCERKVLPEFPQFKAFKWTEVTDKNEMVRIMKERLKLKYAFLNQDRIFKESLNDHIRWIESGEFKLYLTQFDVDDDGKVDVIYKGVSFWGGRDGVAREYNLCNLQNSFYVKNDSIDLEKASSMYLKDPSTFMNLDGHNDIFYSNKGRLFSSNWSSQAARNDSYNIYIYAPKNSLICGINVIQQLN